MKNWKDLKETGHDVFQNTAVHRLPEGMYEKYRQMSVCGL
jgi:hypothetical protein